MMGGDDAAGGLYSLAAAECSAILRYILIYIYIYIYIYTYIYTYIYIFPPRPQTHTMMGGDDAAGGLYSPDAADEVRAIY